MRATNGSGSSSNRRFTLSLLASLIALGASALTTTARAGNENGPFPTAALQALREARGLRAPLEDHSPGSLEPEKWNGFGALPDRVKRNLASPTRADQLPAFGANVRANNPAGDLTNDAQHYTVVSAWGRFVLVAWVDTKGRDNPTTAPPNTYGGYAYSCDWGQTFSDAGNLPHPKPNEQVYFPSLANNGRGRFYMVATCDTLLNASGVPQVTALAFCEGSFDTTACTFAWGPRKMLVPVASSGNTPDFPRVIADPYDDYVYIAYTEYAPSRQDVRFIASPDRGQSWSSPVMLTNSSTTWSLFPDLAVGPDHELYVCWGEYSWYYWCDFSTPFSPPGPYQWVKSTNRGASWTAPATMAPRYSNYTSNGPMDRFGWTKDFPRIAVDRSSGSGRGNVYAVYGGSGVRSAGTGTGATVPEVEPNTVPSGALALNVGDDATGNSSATNDRDLWKVYLTAGQVLSARVEPQGYVCGSTETTYGYVMRLYPEFADPSVFSPDSMLQAHYHTSSIASLTFSCKTSGWYYLDVVPQNIVAGLTYVLRTRLVSFTPVAGSGRDEGDILFTRSTNGGASWSTPMVVNADVAPGYQETGWNVNVDASGRVRVVWHDHRETESSPPLTLRGQLTDLYVAESSNQGLTFGSGSRVSDESSLFGLAMRVTYVQVGFHGDLQSDGNHLFFGWDDMRLSTRTTQGVDAMTVFVDKEAPRTAWMTAPAEAGFLTSAAADFTWSVDDRRNRFDGNTSSWELRDPVSNVLLGSGAFSGDSSKALGAAELDPRGDGPFRFDVYARDAGSNTAPVMTRHFLIDRVAPAVTITSGPAAGSWTSSTSAIFTWSASDPTPGWDGIPGSAGAETSYRLDGAAWSVWGGVTSANYTSLLPGAHQFDIRARDAAGNVTAQSCPFNTTGLVGWWPGEGSAGDSWGTNNGTLLNGASLAVGRRGQAFSLDGVDDYVLVPDNVNLDPETGSFSVEAWVKTGAAGSERIVMIKYEPGLPNPNLNTLATYHLTMLASGQAQFFVRDIDGGGPVSFGQALNSPGPSIADNAWHYLVGTRNFANGTLELYVDGLLALSQPIGPGASGRIGDQDGAPDPLLLGATYQPGGSTPTVAFNGLIDEPAYWSRALSAAEIAANFASGGRTPCTAGASRQFTIDTQAPETQITLGPATGSLETGTSATFTVGGTDDQAVAGSLEYAWSLDSGSLSSFSTATTVPLSALSQGAHTFSVVARDAAGNVDATPATRTWRVQSVALQPTRYLLVANYAGSSIYRFKVPATGAPVQNLTLTTNVDHPGFLSVAPWGELMVVNVDPIGSGGSIARFLDPAGTPVPNGVVADNNGVPGFNFARPFAADFRGSELVVANADLNNVLRFVFDSAGQAVSNGTIGGFLSSLNARGLAVGRPSQELFTSEANRSSLQLNQHGFDAAGNPTLIREFGGAGSNYHGIAFAPWGEMFVADYGTNMVRRFVFDAGGVPSSNGTIAGNGVGQPVDLTFSGWGELFVSNNQTATVSRFTFDPAHNAIPNGTFAVPGLPSGLRFALSGANAPVILAGPPDGGFSGASPTFSWTSSPSVPRPVTYSYSVDGGEFSSASPDTFVTLGGLGNGPHTFEVRSTDDAGAEGSTLRAWTVDSAPPTVAITGPQGGWSNSTSVSVSWTGADNTTPVSSLEFARALDGAPLGPFGPATSASLTDLQAGAHSLEVRVRDLAGNEGSANSSFTVDLVAPETQITGGPTDASTLSTNSATFDFTGSDNLTPLASLRFQSRLDGAAYSAAAASTTRTFTGMLDGPHTFDVRAVDLAGSVDDSPSTRSFTVDAQGPAITIAVGPSNNACVAATDVSFVWSATDAVTPQAQIEFSYRLDAAPFTAYGPVTDASFSSLAEGLHTFVLQARDGGGNESSVSVLFRVDVSAPVAAAPTTRVLDSSQIRIQCTATDNSGTTGFRVQVSTDPAFGSLAADVQIAAAGTYDFIGVPGNSYYARSQAGDCAGNLSAFTGPSNVAILANLPNLVVTNVTAPPAAISGQSVTADYTVTNNGAGPTSTPSWTESVYLSPTSTFNAGTAVLLGSRQNVTFLGVGESYTGSVTGTIPLGTSGARFILVVADAGNAVPESNGTDNTTSSGVVAVTLGAIADLVVTQVVAPPTTLSSETITVSWTVHNAGAGRTDASQWWDTVFLSDDPVFDFTVLGGGNIRVLDQPLARFQRTGVLEPDSSYTRSEQVTLPAYFGGTRYLLVASDLFATQVGQAVSERGAVFEDQHELNTTTGNATEVTQQLPPDLTVDALTTLGSPASGVGLQVTFKIGNHGFHATGAGAWTDQLYLSNDAALDGSDVLLGSFPHSGNVELDDSYVQTVNVTIPSGTSGPRHVIVKADAYAQLVEFLENNNVVPIAQPITVALSPWANLVPVGVAVGDTVMAGGSGLAQWQVTNVGAAAVSATWTDNIELSASPVWTPSARVSGTKRANHALQASDTYAANTTFDVPTSYSGTYYVFARTDAQNEVYEHSDEGDNVALVGTVYVKPYPAIDLAVTNVTAPASGTGGTPLAVSYTVTNTGAGTTLAGWWAEEVWLSADVTFNAAQDLQVATPGHAGALASGAGYTRQLNVTVPLGLNATYHVLVRTDPAGGSGDGSLANNTVASLGTVVVTSPAPPQLTVSAVTVAANLDAGQPAQVGWQLNNSGAGAVPNAEWYVGVYLSQDPWLDGSDVSLGNVAGPAGLAGATSMPQQLMATMPVWASGAYYVLVRTDNRNEVWESGAENDNTATAPTVLTLPPPSDLVVTDVVVPAAAVPGEPVLVSYTLTNQGTNPAVGQLQNAVYMSSDVAFVSEADPLVGVEVVNVNLPPGTSQRFTHRLSAQPLQVDLLGNVTGLLPALTPGAYHAIVKANIRDNIREQDGSNNQTVSTAQVQTDLPSLLLNVPAPFSLASAQAKFYKVAVPADFDLRLTLSSGVVDATNEMFVAFGRTPDENEYDFASPAEFTANPVVLVPQTQAGTYYIMVVARSLGQVASLENLTLLAETLPFSITSHTPGAGGAGGRVTMRVRGAGLRDTTEMRLEQAGIVKARAKLAKFTNSTDLLARFDLTGVAEGLYDLVAANGLTTVVVPGGFAVETARPIEVAIETDNADVLRRTATAPFTVRLRNPSNQDAPMVTARILFPATSQLKSLETSPGLFRSSQLAPTAGDAAVLHRAGGTDSLEVVDVVGSNLAPGEVRTLTLGLAGFESSPYSVRVLADAMTLRTFLDRQQADHEAARRALLADPNGLPATLVMLANDAWAFRDTALWNTYVVPGVLAASDVDDYLFEIDHQIMPSPVYPGLPVGPQSLLDELAAGGPCAPAGLIPECTPDVAVPGTGLPACATVFDALDLPVALGLSGGLVAKVAGSTAAGFTATASANARVVVPCDPNLITGPAGFGTEKWVRASLPMQYRVDFENLPGVASAPAQVVRIVVPIDPGLDPASFRVGGMGFGGTHQINVPAGRTSYSVQTFYSDLNLSVRVTVGINLTTREASWVFTTLDPATGQQPTNPYIGFLPVNDDIGSGTGFATYTVQPYANAALGSTVQAQASIRFDANNPVPTNLAANRVDPRAPASAALTSIEVLDPTRVRVHWMTNNDSTGAGVANVTLYARQDTGPFTPVAPPVSGNSLEVPVTDGHTFGFYTLAADNVGNAEAPKLNPEAALTLGTPQLAVDEQLPRVTALHANFPNPFRGMTSVRFDLARAETVNLEIYDVQGRLVSKLLDGKRLEAGTHTIEVSRLPRGAGVYFYRFRAGQFEKTRRMVLIP